MLCTMAFNYRDPSRSFSAGAILSVCLPIEFLFCVVLDWFDDGHEKLPKFTRFPLNRPRFRQTEDVLALMIYCRCNNEHVEEKTNWILFRFSF